MLIVGGQYSYQGSVRPSNHAFVYSPARTVHAASVDELRPQAADGNALARRQVLIAGGGGDFFSLADRAEIFDPTTNTFAIGPSMVVPRYGASAAPLPDGRVLIAGGWDRNDSNGQPVTMVEVYGIDRIFAATFD